MLRLSKAAVLVACVLVIGFPSQARSGFALNFSSVTGGFADSVPRVIGWEFTTGSQALSVNQLGVFDYKGEALLASHGVAIYNYQTQQAVVTATVPSGSSATLTGLFRDVSVTPTILQANTSYVIAASWAPNADPFVWSPSIGTPSADIINLQVDPAITLGITSSGRPPSGRYLDTTSTLQFPTKRIGDVYPGDPRQVFVGPNFTFTPASVPEPASLAMLGIGTLMAAGHGILRSARSRWGVTRA